MGQGRGNRRMKVKGRRSNSRLGAMRSSELFNLPTLNLTFHGSGGWLASISFADALDNYLSFNIISIIRHQKSHRKTGCKSR